MLFGRSGMAHTATINEICKVRNQLSSVYYPNQSHLRTTNTLSELTHRHTTKTATATRTTIGTTLNALTRPYGDIRVEMEGRPPEISTNRMGENTATCLDNDDNDVDEDQQDIQMNHEDETDDIGIDNMLIESSDDDDEKEDDVDVEEGIAIAEPEVVVDADPSMLAPESGNTEQHLSNDSLREVDGADDPYIYVPVTNVEEPGSTDSDDATKHHQPSENSTAIHDKQQASPSVENPVTVERQDDDDISVSATEDSDDDIEILETQCIVNSAKDVPPEENTFSVDESNVDDVVILETQAIDVSEVDEGGHHKFTLLDDTTKDDVEDFQTHDPSRSSVADQTNDADRGMIANKPPLAQSDQVNIIPDRKKEDETLATQQETEIDLGLENSKTEQNYPPTPHTNAALDVSDPQKRNGETTMTSPKISENENSSLEKIHGVTISDETNALQTQPNELLIKNVKEVEPFTVAPSIDNTIIFSENATNHMHLNNLEDRRSKKRRKKEFCFGGDALRSLISYTT